MQQPDSDSPTLPSPSMQSRLSGWRDLLDSLGACVPDIPDELRIAPATHRRVAARLIASSPGYMHFNPYAPTLMAQFLPKGEAQLKLSQQLPQYYAIRAARNRAELPTEVDERLLPLVFTLATLTAREKYYGAPHHRQITLLQALLFGAPEVDALEAIAALYEDRDVTKGQHVLSPALARDKEFMNRLRNYRSAAPLLIDTLDNIAELFSAATKAAQGPDGPQSVPKKPKGWSPASLSKGVYGQVAEKIASTVPKRDKRVRTALLALPRTCPSCTAKAADPVTAKPRPANGYKLTAYCVEDTQMKCRACGHEYPLVKGVETLARAVDHYHTAPDNSLRQHFGDGYWSLTALPHFDKLLSQADVIGLVLSDPRLSSRPGTVLAAMRMLLAAFPDRLGDIKNLLAMDPEQVEDAMMSLVPDERDRQGVRVGLHLLNSVLGSTLKATEVDDVPALRDPALDAANEKVRGLEEENARLRQEQAQLKAQLEAVTAELEEVSGEVGTLREAKAQLDEIRRLTGAAA